MKKNLEMFWMYIINRPWIVFFMVTVFITLPMWQSGYLFLLDWGVTDMNGLERLSLLQQSFVRMLTVFLSSSIHFGLYQKIVFFVIFNFLGLGGYLFVQEIISSINLQTNNHVKLWVKYIGGMMMLINPFVYARAVDGQWIVVASVVGLLYMMIYLMRWRNSQKRKDIVLAIIFSVMTVMLSQHAIFFVCGVSLIFFSLLSWERRSWKILLVWLVLIASIITANINVMIGYVFHLSDSSDIVSQFNDSHLHVFRIVKDGYASIYTNVLSLHGYWGEGESRFLSTQEHVYIWKPVFFIFLSVIGIGLWIGMKNFVVRFLFLTGVASYILAMGTQSIFAPISQFLYDNIPFYIGLREPQKWSGVLLICFVGLMMYGLFHIMRQQKKLHVHILGIFFIVLTILYTPTMLWGFHGQMISEDYPDEWYDVRSEIGCDVIETKILFLPWHQYMKMDFLNNKKIVNPAKGFFGNCVVQGDNMEADNVYTQEYSEQSQIIEKYLKSNIPKSEFVEDLRKLNIEYIFISKSEDWKDYDWIENISNLDTVKSGDFINIYKIRLVDN